MGAPSFTPPEFVDFEPPSTVDANLDAEANQHQQEGSSPDQVLQQTRQEVEVQALL